MTKLQTILSNNGMTQAQLIEMITNKTGRNIGKDRISKICTGRMKNYSLVTAKIISTSLGVSIDDIVEDNLLEAK